MKRSQFGQPFMDDFVSTVPMLESAIATLVWRWGLSPKRSLTALTEVADELDVDLGDLAVLVLASELQLQAQRATHPATSPPTSRSTSGSVSLSVVGDSTTALGRHTDEADPTGSSWSMRHPGQLGEARSRRLVQLDAAPATRWPGAHLGLSRRESEIVALLALGMSNQEIAERCYLSINSIKTYIRSAYRKMGVKSRTQALLWAVDHGLRPLAPEQAAASDAGPEPSALDKTPLRGLPSLRQHA